MQEFKEEVLEFEELEEQADSKLIPEKSKEAYSKEYDKLMAWIKSKNSETVNESLMLDYMMEQSRIYKSSTLCCIHSKLQAMLRINDGVDLSSFYKLHEFMKQENKICRSQKPLIFTEEELRRFFVQAPDENYLFLKVVTMCGIFGSCRRYEMCDLLISDITKEGAVLVINIRPSKTEKGRKFTIVDDDEISYVQLFNKYLSLRPKNVRTDRAFLKYANGKCTKQVVGINTFGSCPSRVARYLNLPDSEKYTGHAFRRTSATIMGGMSVKAFKRQIGWKSSMVDAGDDEEPTVNKLNVDGERVASILSLNGVDVEMINDIKETSSIHISNNSNCTINIYLKQK